MGIRRLRPPPPPPVFFVTAHSKGVAGENLVSAHSKRLKVVLSSVTWRVSLSADSKGFKGVFSILISILLGTVHSKGVRRTAWWGRMVHRARKVRADLTTPSYHIGTISQ